LSTEIRIVRAEDGRKRIVVIIHGTEAGLGSAVIIELVLIQ